MVVQLLYQWSGRNVTQYSIYSGGPIGCVTKFGARFVMGYVGFRNMGYRGMSRGNILVGTDI